MADEEERRLQIASLRYRVIAEAAESQGPGVSEALLSAASQRYPGPDGLVIEVTPRTLWRWLEAYRRGGLLSLRPKVRGDRGLLRAFPAEVLDKAAALRRENELRATKTIIDILERQKVVDKGALARATLDRHLDRLGLSRRRLHRLGKTTYRAVRTDAPFELVVADFHHGPYVRLGDDDQARRALLLVFIDHFSRFVPEGRYFLHEDFAALRFSFRRLLVAFGCFTRLYIDNGPSFQTARFHAACSHETIDIQVVHSKPYVSEGRGVCERFNRTIKEQFESEVRARDELMTLDELNASFEAWLAERYHQDVHSETGEAPRDRFTATAPRLRAAPDLTLIDELLRLRVRRTVHKKWSTVEVATVRYLVDAALRGRRVHALYDPFDPAYVLVEYDGRIVQRALPQKPGQQPPDLPAQPAAAGPKTDYLALLRADYEKRVRAELNALSLRPATTQPELSLPDLVALVESCRGGLLTDRERTEVSALFRKLRPIDPESARSAIGVIRRQLGTALHLRVYLDALQKNLVRQRTKGGKSS
jgi:putative transposase